MRCPGNTRDGKLEAPIDPCTWNICPCDLGPPANLCLFTTPANPRPFEVPITSTNLASVKMSTSTRSPALVSSEPSAAASTSTSLMTFTGGASVFLRWPFCALVMREAFTNSTSPICAASYPSLAAVFNCVIPHGPACNTVIGCTSPFSSKTCVMPIFFPRIPVTAISSSPHHAGSKRRTAGPFSGFPLLVYVLLLRLGARRARPPGRPVLLLKRLDLDVYTGRKIELHQRVHRLLRRLKNVDQTLVGSNLERLARLLIHVRRTQHAVLVLDRRQWNRSRYRCSGSLGRLHNLAGRGIQHAIVVCLQPNSNPLTYHWLFFPSDQCSVNS